MAKKKEDQDESVKMITVLKPIHKNNIFVGYAEKQVPEELAKKQLALPTEKRNSAWRGVKVKEEAEQKID